MMFYSPSTGGFYPDPELYANAPLDLIEIEDSYHESLIAAQAAGKSIRPGMDGVPIAVDPPAPSLDEQRAAATISRTVFCQRLWRLGILTQPEAVAAARGEWPQTFAGFAATLTSDQAADAAIEWAGAQTIRYTAPLLQAIALARAGGDQAAATATLDALFEIA